MLDVNSSLFLVFFLVCALYLVLTRIFFMPVGRVIDEREAKAAGETERLSGMMVQVESQTQALEAQLAVARKDAQQIRDEWSRKSEALRTRIVTEAKDQALRSMDEKMNALANEIGVAEKVLEDKISVFSEKIKQAYL